TGTTSLVSVNAAGTGSVTGESFNPSISADGNVIAFFSSSTDLTPLTPVSTYNIQNVFARNLATATTSLLSVNSAGTAGGDGSSSNPVISADGNIVAFSSLASNLVQGDFNASADVFVRGLANGTTVAAMSSNGSVVAATAGGSSRNYPSSVSADGRYV